MSLRDHLTCALFAYIAANQALGFTFPDLNITDIVPVSLKRVRASHEMAIFRFVDEYKSIYSREDRC